MPNPWEMDWSGVPNDSSPWDFDWGDPNKLQAGRQYSPEDAAAVGKAQGLSEDEIKRNYALKFAQTSEAATPDPALGIVGHAAKGTPIVGAAVPNLPSMDWLSREHPNVAKGAEIAGAGVGSVPFMAAAPMGIPGAMLAGGALAGSDRAARQVYNPESGKLDPSKFDPTKVAIDAGVGAAGMGASRVMSRLLSPTNKVAGKFQIPEYGNLPTGVKNAVGAAGVALAATPHLAHGNIWSALTHGTEAGLASHYAAPYLYDVGRPIVNRAIANRASPYFQDIINALMGGATAGARSTE